MAAYQISVPGPVTSREAGQMRELLNQQAARLERSGFSCCLEEFDQGTRTVFYIQNRVAGEKSEQGLRHSLGRAVADYYLAVNEPNLIRRIITQDFHYWNPGESREIERYAYHLLDDSEAEEPSHRRRKHWMARQIAKYFCNHRDLAVDGYFQFRMKRYRDILMKLVEHAIDEYLLDQEYREFIDLLRYFVSIQQPKVPLVHVLHIGIRRFRLLDGEGRPLQMKEMDHTVEELMDQVTSHEDLIVSTLLTVAPEQVVLHTRNREENVVCTLMQVFEDRITICNGCSGCRHLKGREDGFVPKG
ncbi:hypothetical protein GCM10007416_27370 [Kroppenstedtia guangzhouensis]|uniref:Sporulation protein YtxC n=1 Tax=Kroppenstedtia guangzhouensis TaxID=1274356 RepID=A0ABQ1GZE1_9BACL|nr:putative sporulation protein YtxC [Kroppenstedtia guangzhouensis]GGA52809.1 hypothetical protein GCM10007416_27370 [Kroppenstedtia guangzhouensis]